MEHAAQLLIQDPTGAASQEYLAQKRLVSFVMPQYLYGVPGTLMEHSYQRQSRVEEIEKILASHEQILADITFATLKSRSSDKSTIRLFLYSSASSLVKNTLEQVMDTPDAKQSVKEIAYDTYFMIQLDDAQFRKNFVDFIITHRNQRNTLGRLADGLYTMSGRWAIPEMEELYLQAIQTPVVPENYVGGNNRLSLISDIENAAAGFDYYGIMPTNYIEAIKARIKELDLTSGDERNAFQQLEQTLAIMEGRRTPEFAVSWKGQLLGVSKETYRKWFGHDRMIQDAAFFDQSTQTKSELKTNSTQSSNIQSITNVVTSEAETVSEKENTSWLTWMTIVIGLTLVTGLWLKFSKQKKQDETVDQ